jgi:hypothetical protein
MKITSTQITLGIAGRMPRSIANENHCREFIDAEVQPIRPVENIEPALIPSLLNILDLLNAVLDNAPATCNLCENCHF